MFAKNVGMCLAMTRSTRRMEKRWSAELELVGAGGEPVDLWRTLASHGVARLPPDVPGEDARKLEAMAKASEAFYKNTVRAGYRGPYLRSLASDVAGGKLDLEALNDPKLPDEEVAARLLALPGCGPYATAHMMMLLGRYSRLILDSWTRPKYARLRGRKASDKTIERRFRPYRDYAGLAFWLYLTRDWVEEPA